MKTCFFCIGAGNVHTGDPGRFQMNFVECPCCFGTGVISAPISKNIVMRELKTLDTEIKSDTIRLSIAEFPTLEDVAVHIGLFPSKTQARKNGWAGPSIPMQKKIKKNKFHLILE